MTQISEQTQLHRTTVRRLLQTLTDEGFALRSEEDGAFQLTPELKRMGESSSVYDELADAALPILRTLSEEVTWPCSIATPDQDTMMIRATTHDLSPLSFHRGMVGKRLPMLLTSMGRAYLAFCSPKARSLTLDYIKKKYTLGEEPPLSLAAFTRIVEKTTSQGYPSNNGEWIDDAKVSAIAVPVKKRATVVGCINIVATTRAVEPRQLATRFLPALTQAARDIEAALRKSA